MYSNKILNFQESTPILNACTKKAGNLLKAPCNFCFFFILMMLFFNFLALSTFRLYSYILICFYTQISLILLLFFHFVDRILINSNLFFFLSIFYPVLTFPLFNILFLFRYSFLTVFDIPLPTFSFNVFRGLLASLLKAIRTSCSVLFFLNFYWNQSLQRIHRDQRMEVW